MIPRQAHQHTSQAHTDLTNHKDVAMRGASTSQSHATSCSNQKKPPDRHLASYPTISGPKSHELENPPAICPRFTNCIVSSPAPHTQSLVDPVSEPARSRQLPIHDPNRPLSIWKTSADTTDAGPVGPRVRRNCHYYFRFCLGLPPELFPFPFFFASAPSPHCRIIPS